jgi:hypothetical protein
MFRGGNSGTGRENEEGKQGWIWLKYFHTCEYGTLKPVEVSLRTGGGEEGE